MNALPCAVLCDMDGTLVDTEPLWWRTVEHTAYRLGVPDVDPTEVTGRPVSHTAGYLLRRSGAVCDVAAELHSGFRDRLARQPIPVMPGALALLARVREAGLKLALVSASPRDVVDLVRAQLGAFDACFADGDTALTKPSPQPYLAAVAALDVPLSSCLVVEDSPTGVRSAEAAGLPVIVVGVPGPDVPGRTYAAGLDLLDLPFLAAALARRVTDHPGA